MNNQLLNFLGRDSGFGKNNNSAYIEDKKNLILIDCGYSVFEKVKEKFDISKYNSIYVVITHLHNDHAGSLSQLILYSWFIYNKKVTVVSKCERIKEYLDITGTPSESYKLVNNLENLEFIKTEHTKYLDAYGFVAIIQNKKIVYTGDTNTLEPFLEHLKTADELYVDVSRYGGAHIKIDDIIDKLKKVAEKNTRIYLMHLDDKEYIKKIINDKFYID